MKRALIGAAALLLSACAGLTTPPIDTPHSTFSVTLNQMTGGNYGSSVYSPIGLPPVPSFRMPAQAIDVPSNARNVNLASAILHLRLTNKMQMPLTLQLALSKQSDPYGDPTASLGSAITIQPQETKPIDQNVDPSLFKQEKLYLGVTFSSPGTSQPVTVSGTDSVDGEAWATVQVKLL